MGAWLPGLRPSGARGPAAAQVAIPWPARPGPAAGRRALPAAAGAAPRPERRAGRDVGPEPTSAPRDTHLGGRAGAPHQALSALRPAPGEAAVGRAGSVSLLPRALSVSAG